MVRDWIASPDLHAIKKCINCATEYYEGSEVINECKQINQDELTNALAKSVLDKVDDNYKKNSPVNAKWGAVGMLCFRMDKSNEEIVKMVGGSPNTLVQNKHRYIREVLKVLLKEIHQKRVSESDPDNISLVPFLPVRAYHCLRRRGINTFGDLKTFVEDCDTRDEFIIELMKVRNLGKNTAIDIVNCEKMYELIPEFNKFKA